MTTASLSKKKSRDRVMKGLFFFQLMFVKWACWHLLINVEIRTLSGSWQTCHCHPRSAIPSLYCSTHTNPPPSPFVNWQDYQESTHLEQFVTRFLLKETTNQLHSLQSSLECAMETTAEQTRQEKYESSSDTNTHTQVIKKCKGTWNSLAPIIKFSHPVYLNYIPHFRLK